MLCITNIIVRGGGGGHAKCVIYSQGGRDIIPKLIDSGGGVKSRIKLTQFNFN